jgi:hypothetical protein
LRIPSHLQDSIKSFAIFNSIDGSQTPSAQNELTMTALEPWALALIIIASILIGLYLIYRILLLIAPSLYSSMIANNSVSVDNFVGGPPSPSSALKSWVLNRLNVGGRQAKKQPDGGGGYSLKVSDSDKLPGLKVTCRDENGDGISSSSKLPPVIVGTIRMGFGHHRIAYATASWGLNSGDERETWFHDFLNIDSEEAQMIKDTDKLYSKGSRLASEVRILMLVFGLFPIQSVVVK